MPGSLPSVVGIGNVWCSATNSRLRVSPWVADAVVVVGQCDDDPIVQARLVTQNPNSLPWLPGTASLVVSVLFAACSVAARVIMAVDIANVGAIGCGAHMMAAGVF